MNEQLRAKEECTELSDDELDNVSGGSGMTVSSKTVGLGSSCGYFEKAKDGDMICGNCKYIKMKRSYGGYCVYYCTRK
jgi:bacteriocin-like protein